VNFLNIIKNFQFNYYGLYMTKIMSRSRQLAAKVTFCALEILVEKGGEATVRDVILEIEIV
jgi:hypothetical protein